METIAKKTVKGNTVYVVKFEANETPFEHDTEGVCIACGEIADGVEPDAVGYKCESCGLSKVYGVEEMVLMGYARFSKAEKGVY